MGVSKDRVQSHQKFKATNKLPFSLLRGTGKTRFLIDEGGVVKKAYRKVKPKEHAEMGLMDLSSNTR